MDTKQQELLNRITIKPGLMGGRPTIRGLRFPVSDILELLASGLTEIQILEQHPILEQPDIQAALLFVEQEKRTASNLTPKFGSAKGMFVMHDDFDDPLEDFSDYMP